jgi:hypothetical protein
MGKKPDKPTCQDINNGDNHPEINFVVYSFGSLISPAIK